MQDTRILFFDIDGTLIDGKCNRLTEPTRQALCALRRRGVRLCIATGRAPMELPPFPGVAFDAFLTYNGSYCFSGERVIFSNPLDRADVQTIRRNAAARHIFDELRAKMSAYCVQTSITRGAEASARCARRPPPGA